MIKIGLLLFYLTKGGAYDLILSYEKKLNIRYLNYPQSVFFWLLVLLIRLRLKTMQVIKKFRHIPPLKRNKKASDLLRHGGTWQGDDLSECLDFVRDTRSETEF